MCRQLVESVFFSFSIIEEFVNHVSHVHCYNCKGVNLVVVCLTQGTGCRITAYALCMLTQVLPLLVEQ